MIVARVQAHPSRGHLHRRLAKALAPLPVELRVHASDPPDPWANYRSCLSDLPDCSHALIVQDDAMPCRSFAQGVEAIAERHSNVPVCLFLGGLPSPAAAAARRAMQKDKRFIPLGVASFMPLVAVLWPREKAEEFLFWAESSPRMTRADDGNAARWARATKQQVLATVPSLVEHDDSEPSVKGGRDHKPWAESWRQALFLAENALDYEW